VLRPKVEASNPSGFASANARPSLCEALVQELYRGAPEGGGLEPVGVRKRERAPELM